MDIHILWVDDEIESLKSQFLFLEQKGYKVEGVSNGYDALDFIKENKVDIVLLDESMPGMTGIETLSEIKSYQNSLPVIMVTKNEEEYIMEDAIGAQITDYLIKPVNPNQVLLSIKKALDSKRLISEKTTSEYQKDFRNLFMALSSVNTAQEWIEIYKKLTYWELQMSKSGSSEMMEVFQSQKSEANNEFYKFVSKNYIDWINNPEDPQNPILSHQLFSKKVIPYLRKDKTTFFILIDNLRYDQWKVIKPYLLEYFTIKEEDSFFSILPTSTQYSRNSIFSGLLPKDIEKRFPEEWKNDDEEGGKNLYEDVFLKDQLKRNKLENIKAEYLKITNNHTGKQFEDQIHNYLENDLNVIVYNFVDMLSHARTEIEVLKELANDEQSYRSLTASWFEHSPLFRALKKVADKNLQLIIATDHGTIQVKNPSKCIGDRDTTTNIRYKHGRNLQFDDKDVFAITEPKKAGLPQPNVNSKFIFAKENIYLCYPNNYNYYVNYFRNTFQHGGISLEEMIVPIVRLESK